MTVNHRQIVIERRMLGNKVAPTFLALEASSHDAATHAARCVTALLEAHSAAALPPATGNDVINMLSDAAMLHAQARSKVVQAHAMLRAVADDNGIIFAADAACPPNTGALGPQLTLAA